MRPVAEDPVELPEPPEHLLQLDPERYREVAKLSLKDHPGDAWCAAFMMWRVWQVEAQRWQAEHGLVWGMKGYDNQLAPGRPPMAWVCAEFALSGDRPDTACPEDCRTHRLYREMYEGLPGRKQHRKVVPHE